MPITSFPIQTKNVTGLSPITSSAGQTKIILISGTGAYLIDSNSLGSSGAITTGAADTRYYPLTGNPSGFVLSGELNASGQFLYNLIGASAAGVSTLNAASGNVLLTGTGNITVTRNGQTIIISGATGAYANFVTVGQTGNFITNGMTGALTGDFVRRSETGQFAASGNLTATGINLQGQLNTITNWTGTTPSIFSNINHGHNYVTGVSVTGGPSQTGLISISGFGNVTVTTGVSGLIQVSGNTGAYANFVTPGDTGLLTNAFVLRSETGGFGGGTAQAGVTSLGATGITNTGLFTGNVLLSGAGNIVVSTGTPVNKLIVVSGDTGAYSNFALKSETGQFVTTAQTGGLVSSANTGNFVTTGQTGLLPNVFYPLNSNPANYLTVSSNVGVRSLQTTGAYPSGIVSGNVVVSGTSSISVTTGVNGTIVISGDTGMFGNFTTDSELLGASGYLVSLISASSAGVASLNGLSGVLNILGSGNITVFTGAGFITISGNTGAYVNFLTPATVGGVRGIVPTGTSRSGIVSGNVIFTGAGNVSIETGISGLVVVSGDTGAYGNFVTLSQTGGLVSSAHTGTFVTTGQTGQLTNVFYPLNSNPSNYLTSSTVGGVRIIVPTGTANSGQISGNVILTGAGNVSVFTGISGHIVISGDTGAYANFLSLSQTGRFAASGDVVYVTGNQNITGIKSFQSPIHVRNSGSRFGNNIINNTGYNDIISLYAGNDIESPTVGYSGTGSPSHGIGFYRIFAGTDTGTQGGIFGYGTPNWGGGLVLAVKPGGLSQNDPEQQSVVFQPDKFVGFNLSGQALENIHTSGRIRSDIGFMSGSTPLINLLYPRNDNPSGYLTASSNVGVRSIQTTGAYPSGIVSGNIVISGISIISVTTGGAGQIVISGNTDSFTTDAELLDVSGYLVNLISASAAGVASLNGQSGVLNILGSGNVTVFTGVGFITVSGNTGAYANFLTPSTVGGVRSLTLTGHATQSGTISGNVILTGAGNVSVYTGISGLGIVSGDTGAYANFVSLSQTGGLVSSANTGVFVTTGQTGALTNVFYPLNSNPSSYLTSTTVGGVRMIVPTGTVNSGNISGNVILSGAGNVSVFTGISGHIIVSGNTGAYSVFALKSETGQFITTAQTGIFATTGQTGLLTNVFYPLTNNPAGYITVSSNVGVRMIIPTGTVNSGQISGNVIFTGAGNVTTFTGISGHIVVSGNTGAYANFITPSQTGLLTGQFYPLHENPSGYVVGQTGTGILDGELLIGASGINGFQQGNLYGLTGIVVVSGSGSLGVGIDVTKVVTGLVAGTNVTVSNNGTGLWTINSSAVGVSSVGATGITNTGSFTGHVLLTGAGNIIVSTGTPENRLIVVSGNTGAYANFVSLSQTGGLVSSAHTGIFVTTGQSGQLTNVFYPLNSNPANYLTVSNEVGVRRIIPTGTTNSGMISGNVILTGAGNVTTSTGISGHIVISGNTGAYANFVTLSQTGNVVNTSQTGGFASIQVTGSPLLSLVNLSGAGNVIVSTGERPLVVVSGNTGAYSSFVTLSQTGGFITASSLISYMSITGDRTANTAPLNIPFSVITTGVNFTNTGSFRIYTVPTNLFLAPDSFELITKGVSGITTGAAFGVGSSGLVSEFISGYRITTTGLWGRGNYDLYINMLTGGQNINFNIYSGTTGAANTIHSGYFILRGTLYSGI